MAAIDHQFPQFDAAGLEFSNPNLFLDGDDDFTLPLGFASDLDDISVDFSLDDYLVNDDNLNPDPGPDPDPDRDPHPPSPESSNYTSSSSSSAVVINHDGEVKVEEQRHKRKNDQDKSNPNPNSGLIHSPSPNSSSNPDPNLRSVKYRRSDEANSPSSFSIGGEDGHGDDKRKARLMRNRESAQLSRQRKKHYVEELEDKVRAMNSTIAELNGKISFYMSENARLHQQLTGNNGGNPPPPAPPAAAVYPPPLPMHFPWIPYPGYPMHRPGGAQVPLIPIPRLKPQQPAPAPARKAKSKKSGEGKSKTKKVASVSLLGMFLVFLVFGGVLNFGLGNGAGSGDAVSGRVLNVSGRIKGMSHTETRQNSSESIPALLYVPRNGKHVEINGNLIIHSVLASERAMAEVKAEENTKQSLGKEGTGLAIPGNVVPALAVPTSERDMRRHPKAYRDAAEHHRALPSESKDKLKSSVVDGPLQQWFREGLAGPILSSGTCTEVFQFEVSPASTSPSGIIPATTVVNTTDELPLGKMKNRRILYPQLAGPTLNDTSHFGKTSEDNRTFHSNSTIPSMVVSIMADPREAGDGDVDGMIRPKSLSRIFVVVLMDSVKYVTYSCMLPLKSHGPHLVN